MASLMDQAREQRGQQQGGGGELQKPDWRQFTPPELMDDVERIQAAGMKLMYSPEMQQERQEAVASSAPIAETLADNTVGLLLTLDQQAQGGLPVAALFPAAMALLGEAAAVLEAAGKKITQEDWNDAALRMYVLIGKKLGGSDEQIMQGAQQAMGGGEPGATAPSDVQPPQPGQPPAPGAGAASAPEEETEEAAMARGMQ